MIDINEVKSKLCAETHPVSRQGGASCVTPSGIVVHEGSGCEGCIFYKE